MKTSPDKFAQIDQAAHSGAFGINPVPLPTDKQIAAGNYKKGKVKLYGLTIAIEQPQNSYRTGLDKDGKRWACRLAANYGYILGTKGADKDHVDCFIGSYPQSDRVYIINQTINGVFDEHKIMLAYPAIEFAISDYRYSFSRDWDGLHSVVETSVKNFKWWLKNGDMSKPVTTEQLPPESENDMNKIYWDSANQPIGTSVAQLHYDLRKLDEDEGLLLDAVSIGDFILDADAGSVDFGVMLDSLHTPYSSLARVCSKIGFAMKNQAAKDSQGNALTLVESTPDEPNPSGLDTTFKRNGVVNLAAVYQLTDGQSFTIVFHNPDSTPGKLAKTDTLIAWKFLLNKRDITIAVAPEKGEDLKLPEIAKRVMNLAEKNSAAFARANKGVTERAALINSLKTEIAELEIEKTQAQADYEAAKAAYDEREITKATEPKPPFVATHTVDDDGVQVPVKMNDDGVWESENGSEYQDYDAEPIGLNPIDTYDEDLKNSIRIKKEALEIAKTGDFDGAWELVKTDKLLVQGLKKEDWINFIKKEISSTENPNSSTGIDPATLANLNASSLSAALKKKAIAFFEKNPSAKSFEGSGLGKPSQKAIMESIKTALFAEIKSTIPQLEEGWNTKGFDDSMFLPFAISVNDKKYIPLTISVIQDDSSLTGYKLKFVTNLTGKSEDSKNLFDSTTTLEDLRSWGFSLPFDLDVKAFVANVIKPVVEEFLSKQAAGTASSTENPNSSTGIDPATLANLNAASISAAIRKKAIAYLEANPTSQRIEGIGKPSLNKIMESVKTALISEILSLSTKITHSNNNGVDYIELEVDKNNRMAFSIYKAGVLNSYFLKLIKVESGSFIKIFERSSLLDSTSTIEDLNNWNFELPFDLDVKAFVANVIKPVVDEFLSKQAKRQAATEVETDRTPPTMTPEDTKRLFLRHMKDDQWRSNLTYLADYFNIDTDLPYGEVELGIINDKNISIEELNHLMDIRVHMTQNIPSEFVAKFEYVEPEFADDDIEFDQAKEQTQTAWMINQIIKQIGGVVSWGDYNSIATNGSVFDSVLSGIVGQFGTKEGGVIGYIEINDNGEALIKSVQNGVLTNLGDFTDSIQKLDLVINQAYSGFTNPIITEGKIPDWEKSKPLETLPEPELPKNLTEIQKQELKLQRLIEIQNRMKAVNKIMKSKTLSIEQQRAKLIEQGYQLEADNMLGKKDFAGRIGYADYQLTNNNATIRSTQKRIEELKARELAETMATSGDRETSYDFDTGTEKGTVDLDYGDDRLRVNFDKKPASDMIAKLKSNGFKWSPTNSAWQRQLTDNAIVATNYLLGTKIKTASKLVNELENEVPTPTFDTEIESLRSETDIDAFNSRLDDLAARIEAAGLMEQYEPKLNDVADVLTELLKKAAAGVM